MSDHAVVSRLKLNGIEDMSCFNLIAFAFQQSKRLMSVELSSCELFRADMLQLEWLLSENGLDRLVVKDCLKKTDNVLCIAQGLASITSLKHLEFIGLIGIEDSISGETVETIPNLIQDDKNSVDHAASHKNSSGTHGTHRGRSY
jgi:hypothetical protein